MAPYPMSSACKPCGLQHTSPRDITSFAGTAQGIDSRLGGTGHTYFIVWWACIRSETDLRFTTQEAPEQPYLD